MDELRLTRRALLRRMLSGAVMTVAQLGIPCPGAAQEGIRPLALSLAPTPAPLSDDDNALLDEVEHAAFLYFWEHVNPETGIVRDRYNVRVPDTSELGSI